MANTSDEGNAPDASTLRLVGIIGGLTQQPTVADQPVATLLSWRAFRTSAGTVHLVGYCIERAEGRASTALITFDPTSRRCLTTSGRVYLLDGRPGQDSDATWVWDQYKRAASITNEMDISNEFASEIERARRGTE